MEWVDPIVSEVHRIREVTAASSNYDIRAYFAAIREHEKFRLEMERRETEESLPGLPVGNESTLQPNH